jgi:hypothetical protein
MTKRAPRGAILDRECTAFATYLTGREPTGYVLERYRLAHERGEMASLPEPGAFERALVRLALFPGIARVVDVYTALFMKRALVRKKLVLALAILECCAPSYHYFEHPDRGGFAGSVSRLAARSLVSGIALALGAIVLGPAHVVASAASHLYRSR